MAKGFVNVLCENSDMLSIFDPYSCTNHVIVVFVDALLMFMCLWIFFFNLWSRKLSAINTRHWLTVFSTVFNGCLGLVYVGVGIWTIVGNLRDKKSLLPLDEWLVVLLQGVVWLLTLSLVWGRILPKLLSILIVLFTTFLCFPSIWDASVHGETSVKGVLDMLTLPGAILFLICVFHEQKLNDVTKGSLYTPLQANASFENNENVTPMAKAGILSRFTFWWLNPLLMKGKGKVLDAKDIPKLQPEDRAEASYYGFMEELKKRKENVSQGCNDCEPSMLSMLFIWQSKKLVITGLFALIKVLSLASGPLILRAFIKVCQGKQTFEHEGYFLTLGLFLAKCLESVSERQLNFRNRVIGLQVKSMLCAAIYQKQLRLSNNAKLSYSPGEIMNYATVDATRIGEFPFWFHQIWTIGLQIVLGIFIIYFSIGVATFAALFVVILTVLGNIPLGKLQHKLLTKLMGAQDRRLKAITEAITNMKVLKLYAWETHFRKAVEKFRSEELKWLSAIISQRGVYLMLFWSSPAIVAVVTFYTCYLVGIQLDASNVFTFLATIRIIQEPIRLIAEVAAVFIEARVALTRIIKFLEAPELEKEQKNHVNLEGRALIIKTETISWNDDSSKPTLTNIDLEINSGEKVAICGEVGSGKSTLIATILGEVPNIKGTVEVNGKVAYVSQTAWIQTGTIRENILFGSLMDEEKYAKVVKNCSLVKDIEMLPFGDQTIIGERGVNLSGGQKQRVQLARALYQDADVYLLDDPFSAVDAHTAASLFKEYIMEALSSKTVLLVTHQVDFLPAFNNILLMADGKILNTGTYTQLLDTCEEFQNLVIALSDTSGYNKQEAEEIEKVYMKEEIGEQLIKQEEREAGDTGLKPYKQYLSQSKGYLYFSLSVFSHVLYIIGQFLQNYWLAIEVQDSSVNESNMLLVYMVMAFVMMFFLFGRSYFVVKLGVNTSIAVFSKLITSLFRAPMSFYDSTPMGRIISRVSSDLSVIDLDLAMKFTVGVGTTMNTYFSFGILAFLTWPVLFIIIPTVYVTILLQKFYYASAKELMRLDGTSKSFVASHLAQSIAGAVTIRAFGEEDRFFIEHLNIIDGNASPYFHSFSANEWLIQRLEILCAVVVSSSALAITLLPFQASDSGLIGMSLSYGLSLNIFLVISVQFQCQLSNLIVSVERVEQYMHIQSEAPEIIESNRPSTNWPSVGRVVIENLKIRYQPNSPLVLQGISCVFEGGHKIGIVGRTGSGKTTLISALFRLVEPTEGRIIIDDLDITSIGLHDLRSSFGIIPQEPTLFSGSVRYNLDPLSEHSDHELWKVLEKCQLREAIQDKKEGLDSLVVQDGSNWSLGQRQLFCLGRALLKRRKILVLDEATASIDNATDTIIQKTIREEFEDCTVITVAHRIPTVIDCTMVLVMKDGKVMEYDKPTKLMNEPASLFAQLVNEYWSQHKAS
ncbi:ATP-binding cassette subfamily C member 8 [Artemisia annua]|uniref:ABC-type xenobiotic transporter n=1 Tax=Artemisia annua TaxID=35608 RepID=A0A2U1P7D5_ARTAN|nr:ATP-binding cassette subfamily C member 8 [Artemisia annua]